MSFSRPVIQLRSYDFEKNERFLSMILDQHILDTTSFAYGTLDHEINFYDSDSYCYQKKRKWVSTLIMSEGFILLLQRCLDT